MSKENGASNERKLKDLLGHERRDCVIPTNRDLDTWVQGTFKRLVDSLPGDIKSKLLFIDMLFAKVEDDSFFGGIAVRGEFNQENYTSLLKGLFEEYITVGSHKDFEQGFVDDEGNERWFSQFIQRTERDSTKAAEEQMTFFQLNAGANVAGLLPESFSPWRAKANKKPINDAWSAYAQAMSDMENTGLTYLSGIPITIPQHFEGMESLHVASLFLGFAANDEEDGIGLTGAVARRVVPFALRTYAMQKAQQAGRIKEAEAKEKLYGEIEPDIRKLIEQISGLRNTSARIDAAITISNEDFLGHAEILSSIFHGKDVESHYAYREDTGVCVEIKNPQPKQYVDLESNWKNNKFKSVHDDCSQDAWNAFAEFLKHYGQAVKVPIFEDFSKATISDDNKARRIHRLLKLMVQRPSASNNRLFPVQVVIAIAAAWRERLSTASKRVELRNYGSAYHVNYDNDALTLAGFADECPDHLLECLDQHAAPIHDSVTTADVLGALMRLISVELIKGKRERENVEVQSVEVNVSENAFDVLIKCEGRFKNPSENCQIGDGSKYHGFQLALKTLTSSVGQRQPALSFETGLTELQQMANKSPTARFIVGQPEERGPAVIFIRYAGPANKVIESNNEAKAEKPTTTGPAN